MPSFHLVPLAAQVAAPVALLIWNASAASSRTTAVLRTAATAAYLLAIMLAGLWLAVPSIALMGYAAVLALQMPAVVRRATGLPWWPRRPAGWAGFVAACAVTVGTCATLVQAAAGHSPPRIEAVDLEFPLRGGTYLVANGGSNDLVNAHVQTLNDERFDDYRGQSYGLDIVGLNRLGVRSPAVVSSDPSRYVIFGRSIYAPCGGVVLRADDGYPDMSPPLVDREHMPGNFVFLDCGGVHVLLGHMKRGTVLVKSGETVTTGAVLGQVGNSGNTNEPHLHIHAQRPATDDAFLSGDPLVLTLNGRFLSRNDRVVIP